MKRSLFLILVILIAVFCIPNHYANGEDMTIALTGISKLYIEYENGEYQVVDFSDNKVDYSFVTYEEDGFWYTTQTGSAQILVECELEQNSKIAKVAIWVEQFVIPESAFTHNINGYIGFDNSAVDWDILQGITDVPIGDWAEGHVIIWPSDYSGMSSGAFNLNASISMTMGPEGIAATIAQRDSVDANNMIVTIQFADASVLFGGSLGTEDR